MAHSSSIIVSVVRWLVSVAKPVQISPYDLEALITCSRKVCKICQTNVRCHLSMSVDFPVDIAPVRFYEEHSD